MGKSLLSRIRHSPPLLQPGLISRVPELSLAVCPITILSAPTGYGKSQLIAEYIRQCPAHQKVGFGLCSRLGETPTTLLILLYSALELDHRWQQERPWQEQADQLLQHLFNLGPTTLILDDVHHLQAHTSEEQDCALLLNYLLDYRAPETHWIFSGRKKPQLAELAIKALTGEALILGQEALSLSATSLECQAPTQGERLFALTTGWPVACRALLQKDPQTWEQESEKLGVGLFGLVTRDLAPETLDALVVLALVGASSEKELTTHGLWNHLAECREEGNLLQRNGEHAYYVHPLFEESYRKQASDRQRAKARFILQESGRAWEALEFVKEEGALRELLLEHGAQLLRSGRYRLLETLLSNVQTSPELAILNGRLLWHRGNPAEALECFVKSASMAAAKGDNLTTSESWKAAGLLYVEAVCPTEAQTFLKKAYRALGPIYKDEKADILRLLAENAVNSGQARTALRYRKLASAWSDRAPEDLALTARLYLRSGRLSEAHGVAQAAVQQQNNRNQTIDGHRDPKLILSYLCSLQGVAELAVTLADQVLQVALESNDRRSQLVALTRKAHGLFLKEKSTNETDDCKALQLYSQADSLGKSIGMARLRAEPLMGMALVHVFGGDLARARESIAEGTRLAADSGDEWLACWLNFVNALAAVQAEDSNAARLLYSCQQSFTACRDRFGYALCDVWSSVLDTHEQEGLQKHLNEFRFLAEQPSLFGPPPHMIAKSKSTERSKTEPKRLQVFCLGPLSLTKDGQPVPAKAFKRKKARELFALLLAAPDTFFHREELAAQLWPQADQKAALRDFRVALHALSEALEPNRAKNTTAFCIERQEERYRLLSDKLDIDLTRFESLLSLEPSRENLERAVRLFRGSFCEDYPYLQPLESVRQRFDQLYLQAAEQLAMEYLKIDQAPAATELAQKMLLRDPTWEPAYRLLLRSQHALGHEHLLPRTFTRCLETLEEELGVEPSEETFELARELLGDQLATIL